MAGHDIASASEDAPGAVDFDVVSRAANENRVVITFDRDYGELIYRRSAPTPPGLLYLRFRPMDPEEPAERILALLAEAGVDLSRRFSVLERDSIRQRPLP